MFLSEYSITIAATSSAVSSILVGYPFDSLKTRMQAMKFTSTLQCLRITLKNEGISGIYRGVFPLLISSTFLRGLGWNLYISSRNSLQDTFKAKRWGASLNDGGLVQVVVPCTIAGMGTGFVSSLLAAPIEFIKVQRQLQKVYTPPSLIPHATTKLIPDTAAKNMLGWLRHVIKQKGLAGLYTGYRYHAPMDIFGTGVYFAVYESFKLLGPRNSDNSPKSWVAVGGGGLAGAISWIFVFPIDVVKSMVQREGLQVAPKSAAVLIQERFREFGVAGFYRGLSMQLVRSVPVHSLNFYVFEHVLAFCKNHS